MLISLLTTVVDGIKNYVVAKQEIKKVQVEADKKIMVAKADAECKRLSVEAEQNYSLDSQSTKNMKDSWKDELILIVFLAPIVMCFIPDLQAHVSKGFEVLKTSVPDWYVYLLIGMIVVIYGMRGLFIKFLEVIKGFALWKK